jgi:hypothetical protein
MGKKKFVQGFSLYKKFDGTFVQYFGVQEQNYSSGQKFLNDQTIWYNFFVSQPIDLKFLTKLHITIVYFLAKKIEDLVLSGQSYDFKSEFVKVKSI